MATIVGTVNTGFQAQDGTRIEGIVIHVTERIDPKRGEGVSTDRFFLSKKKVDELGFRIEVGIDVEILFNRYGKVATLRRIDDLLID